MNRINNIWNDLKELNSETQILGYWDDNQTKILRVLKNENSDFETATKIIHLLAKSLNIKEKYSAVYYLFTAGYKPIENKLIQSNQLNEAKYELGRGLHHNRKYNYSKKLFNELAQTEFDTNRIKGWWDQSAFASSRERFWLKTDILPGVGRYIIIIAFLFIAIKTKEFVISTTVFIILMEIYEAWWYQYKLSIYLKEFEDIPEIEEVKRNIKKLILIELGISLLFYPLYFLNQEWLIPLVLLIVLYFQIFHFGLSNYYLPTLVASLNRKKTTRQQRI